MSDQFALGLLAQIVDQLEQRVEALEIRLEEMETQAEGDEPTRYMDGTPIT